MSSSEAGQATDQQSLVTSDPVSSERVHPIAIALQSLQPLRKKADSWKTKRSSETLLSKEDIAAVLKPAVQGWVQISVGHDDYTRIPGGVQVCIQREEDLARKAQAAYLNIHPLQPLPMLADDPDPAVTMILNGVASGACRMSDLIIAVGEMTDQGIRASIAIHQLLGHSPEQIAKLGLHAAPSDRAVWLHDFFTLCPSMRLSRNDVSFCGAPDVRSNACSICAYGEERQQHLERMRALFEKLDPVVLSPAKVTQDLWVARSDFKLSQILTVPHQTLTWDKRPSPLAQDTGARIRIGFLGSAARHKGWDVFAKLSYDEQISERFDFVALTANKVSFQGKRIPVMVSPEAPNAAAEEVAKQAIDLVLHWPDWPETFALTAFEALSGGAWLITNEGSGNVAATVKETQRGVVLADEAELSAFLRSQECEQLVKRVRAERATYTVTHHPSRLSLSAFQEAS